MSNGRFKIEFRRRQNQVEGVDVVIQCNPTTGYAEYVPGTVDNVSAFMDVVPVGGWYDFSGASKNGREYIEPETSTKITFTWDKINSGNASNSQTNQDGSNYDKSITSELWIRDTAFHFVYDWLISTECRVLNAVEVRIKDLIANGTYRTFLIKSDNLDYAPIDDPCQFRVKLREKDDNWSCIHKTFIWDNHQNWFTDAGPKTHPCFLTCIEPRPRLVQSARMALMLFYHSASVVTIIDWIAGSDMKEDARKILNANRFVDSPLVRTYIENVAGKCGLAMDTIFDEGEAWENLCIFYPQAGFMYESEDDSKASPPPFFHFDNRWMITIAELLDKLKLVMAAEWYVTPLNTIVFKYKKDLINLLPIYDFTLAGAEPIYDLRYTFNGEKKPAYGRYEYQEDGSDLASQEMSTLYSDIIDYDGPANNPMLEGERVKNFEFAPTGFIRDGRAKDYLELLIRDGKLGALILVSMLGIIGAILIIPVVSAPIAGFLLAGFGLWVGEIFKKATTLKHEFVTGPAYTGAVRLTSEQVLTPRLILWDGLHEQQAKAVTTIALPTPNTFYNPDSVPYDEKNNINQYGDNPDRNIFNYPLYFDGDYWGNLFPTSHDIIDNPLKSLETHQDVKWNVDLCEGMLNLFGVFENQYAQIGKVVKLEHRANYDVYVRIGNISVDYDNNKINLKGTVLRRQKIELPPEDVAPPGGPGGGGQFEESGAIPNPGGGPVMEIICLRWKNNGVDDAVNVSYVDCDGNAVTATIVPGESFCATEIISVGEGGNIVATNTCDAESGSGSGESGDSGEDECCLEVQANEGLSYETTDV